MPLRGHADRTIKCPDPLPIAVPDARAKTELYGGAAFIVGILGLFVGLAYLALGSTASGGILTIVGLGLMLAGFIVARRG